MKNILLAVVGLSPQVVTETLYALHQQGRGVDAIHLITTREGKEAILSLYPLPAGRPLPPLPGRIRHRSGDDRLRLRERPHRHGRSGQ